MSELFKYRKFDGHSLETISDNTIWASKQKDFNDPFECTFEIKDDISLLEFRKEIKSNATADELEKIKNSLIDYLENFHDIAGVFSLSESNRISLMWSHYADSHRGFCIGYGVRDNNHLGDGNCYKILYANYRSLSLKKFFIIYKECNYDLASYSNDKYTKFLYKTMLLSKDPNWRYEREKRVIYREYNQLIKPNFEITSITFGLRMPNTQKTLIQKILNGKNVKFFQAEKTSDSYDLKITPYIL